MSELPLIDISPLEVGRAHVEAREAEVGTAIDRACRAMGFFRIVGHGVDPGLQDRLDRAARAFFALDLEAKRDVALAVGGRAWRGWFPEGGELTAGLPDRKEGIYFGAELPPDDPRVRAGRLLHGPNLFPSEPADLRPAVLAWIEAMTALGHRIVRGLGIGLGLGPSWFDEHLTADPTILFRIFRYPATTSDDPSWGVAEHTDYGLVTILAHDGRPGLEVRGPDGWLTVPATPGTFVVNLGDMLERMTGGAYRSTPHRVRHVVGEDGEDRLSFPFFFDPGWDIEVQPALVEVRQAADAGTDRWDGASVHEWAGTYGDYLQAKVAKVFPELDRAVRGGQPPG